MSSFNNPFATHRNSVNNTSISSIRAADQRSSPSSFSNPPPSFVGPSYEHSTQRGSGVHMSLPPLPPGPPPRIVSIPLSPSSRQPQSKQLVLPGSHPLSRFMTLLQTSVTAHQRKAVQLRRVAALCHYRWLLSDRSIEWVSEPPIAPKVDTLAALSAHSHAKVGDIAYAIRAGKVTDSLPLSTLAYLPAPGVPTHPRNPEKRKKSRPKSFSLAQQTSNDSSYAHAAHTMRTHTTTGVTPSVVHHPSSSSSTSCSPDVFTSSATSASSHVVAPESLGMDEGTRTLSVQFQWLLSELWRIRALQAGIGVQMRMLAQWHWTSVLERVKTMQTAFVRDQGSTHNVPFLTPILSTAHAQAHTRTHTSSSSPSCTTTTAASTASSAVATPRKSLLGRLFSWRRRDSIDTNGSRGSVDASGSRDSIDTGVRCDGDSSHAQNMRGSVDMRSDIRNDRVSGAGNEHNAPRGSFPHPPASTPPSPRPSLSQPAPSPALAAQYASLLRVVGVNEGVIVRAWMNILPRTLSALDSTLETSAHAQTPTQACADPHVPTLLERSPLCNEAVTPHSNGKPFYNSADAASSAEEPDILSTQALLQLVLPPPSPALALLRRHLTHLAQEHDKRWATAKALWTELSRMPTRAPRSVEETEIELEAGTEVATEETEQEREEHAENIEVAVEPDVVSAETEGESLITRKKRHARSRGAEQVEQMWDAAEVHEEREAVYLAPVEADEAEHNNNREGENHEKKGWGHLRQDPLYSDDSLYNIPHPCSACVVTQTTQVPLPSSVSSPNSLSSPTTSTVLPSSAIAPASRAAHPPSTPPWPAATTSLTGPLISLLLNQAQPCFSPLYSHWRRLRLPPSLYRDPLPTLFFAAGPRFERFMLALSTGALVEVEEWEQDVQEKGKVRTEGEARCEDELPGDDKNRYQVVTLSASNIDKPSSPLSPKKPPPPHSSSSLLVPAPSLTRTLSPNTTATDSGMGTAGGSDVSERVAQVWRMAFDTPGGTLTPLARLLGLPALAQSLTAHLLSLPHLPPRVHPYLRAAVMVVLARAEAAAVELLVWEGVKATEEEESLVASTPVLSTTLSSFPSHPASLAASLPCSLPTAALSIPHAHAPAPVPLHRAPSLSCCSSPSSFPSHPSLPPSQTPTHTHAQPLLLPQAPTQPLSLPLPQHQSPSPTVTITPPQPGALPSAILSLTTAALTTSSSSPSSPSPSATSLPLPLPLPLPPPPASPPAAAAHSITTCPTSPSSSATANAAQIHRISSSPSTAPSTIAATYHAPPSPAAAAVAAGSWRKLASSPLLTASIPHHIPVTHPAAQTMAHLPVPQTQSFSALAPSSPFLHSSAFPVSVLSSSPFLSSSHPHLPPMLHLSLSREHTPLLHPSPAPSPSHVASLPTTSAPTSAPASTVTSALTQSFQQHPPQQHRPQLLQPQLQPQPQFNLHRQHPQQDHHSSSCINLPSQPLPRLSLPSQLPQLPTPRSSTRSATSTLHTATLPTPPHTSPLSTTSTTSSAPLSAEAQALLSVLSNDEQWRRRVDALARHTLATLEVDEWLWPPDMEQSVPVPGVLCRRGGGHETQGVKQDMPLHQCLPPKYLSLRPYGQSTDCLRVLRGDSVLAVHTDTYYRVTTQREDADYSADCRHEDAKDEEAAVQGDNGAVDLGKQDSGKLDSSENVAFSSETSSLWAVRHNLSLSSLAALSFPIPSLPSSTHAPPVFTSTPSSSSSSSLSFYHLPPGTSATADATSSSVHALPMCVSASYVGPGGSAVDVKPISIRPSVGSPGVEAVAADMGVVSPSMSGGNVVAHHRLVADSGEHVGEVGVGRGDHMMMRDIAGVPIDMEGSFPNSGVLYSEHSLCSANTLCNVPSTLYHGNPRYSSNNTIYHDLPSSSFATSPTVSNCVGTAPFITNLPTVVTNTDAQTIPILSLLPPEPCRHVGLGLYSGYECAAAIVVAVRSLCEEATRYCRARAALKRYTAYLSAASPPSSSSVPPLPSSATCSSSSSSSSSSSATVFSLAPPWSEAYLASLPTPSINADALFPLVLFILTQARIPAPHLAVWLCNAHLPSGSVDMGECGMCVSLFEAATAHLLDSPLPQPISLQSSSDVSSGFLDDNIYNIGQDERGPFADRELESNIPELMTTFTKIPEHSQNTGKTLFPEIHIPEILKFPESDVFPHETRGNTGYLATSTTSSSTTPTTTVITTATTTGITTSVVTSASTSTTATTATTAITTPVFTSPHDILPDTATAPLHADADVDACNSLAAVHLSTPHAASVATSVLSEKIDGSTFVTAVTNGADDNDLNVPDCDDYLNNTRDFIVPTGQPSLLRAVMEEMKDSTPNDDGFFLEPLPLPMIPALKYPSDVKAGSLEERRESITSISSKGRTSSTDTSMSPASIPKSTNVPSRAAWEAVKQRARLRNAATQGDGMEHDSSLLMLASPFLSPTRSRQASQSLTKHPDTHTLSTHHDDLAAEIRAFSLEGDLYNPLFLQAPSLLNHHSTESDETDIVLMHELIERHGDISE